MDAPMMQIGGAPKDSIDAAANAVVRVAQCSGDPKVAIEALRTMARLAETKNVTVTNCTFTAGPPRTGLSVQGSNWVAPGDQPPVQ